MIDDLKKILWRQFGSSIDMLKNAIDAWPQNAAATDARFFYMVYHTIVFLDYYLSIPPVNFKARLPYTLVPFGKIPADGIDDVVPDQFYSKHELLNYLEFCRNKCKAVISSLTEQNIALPWIDHSENTDLSLSGHDALSYSILEILFYNLKHVQHHAAQLNLLLRQQTGNAPDYVSHIKDDL